MQKVITISRTALRALSYDETKVTYNGVPPDTRKYEPLMAVLKIMVEQ